MYAKQPEKDIDPTHDMLYEYKGILSVFPDVLKVHEVRSKIWLGYISLCFDHIGSVIVSMLTSNAVNCWFEP